MIYIQSNSLNPIPHHFDCACAYYGATEEEKECKLVTYNDVKTGLYDDVIESNLFVGSVEFMREVFNRVGIKDVRVPKNSNREHEVLTLREAHERVADGDTLFIKPFEIKLFTGLILDGCIYTCLEGLPGNTKLMAYEPFTKEVVSEWRIYVHDGNIEDARNYSGEFMDMPNEEYIKEVIKNDCIDFPIAYTIDIGILEDGSNNVIEFNDMWAIGNYGIPNDIYLRMLRDRYFEIINSK